MVTLKATVVGSWVQLEPVSRESYRLLFDWRSELEVNLLNFGRRVATFDEFVGEIERLLQASVFFLVRERRMGAPIGFLCGYNHNPWDGWMWVGAYIEEPFRYRGHGGEASLLGLDFLFRKFPLRMVYTEIYEFARPLLKLSETLGFEEVGYQPNHYWHEDRFWGIHRLSVTRERWDERKERFHDILQVQEELEQMRVASSNGG
jgi:RimJ/RimL family protein N-acetyltransferase